ncbi:RNA-binding S4 domain-containing protein [Phocaeicola sp.]|uniref:RNA-binding S4 domain-containing protein n=1 Tax=Phocaeicola sp. TaxID=2773926 RepID=UPI0023D3A825|nr:RNA-binding S4 domain-containing protein [Phocaeicola sp.]MDE5676753.1 RNA-binding S4 domain-containing protein [Phocaeicola sp.]
MAEARIDKWLWASRIFKTRTIAAEACKKGRVFINGSQVKPSRMIKPGEVIQVKKPPVTYSFKVLQAIEKRVGAKLVPEILENVTTPDQYELLEMSKISGFVDRARGTGRPTKKDRRSLEEFITPEYFGNDDFDFEFDFEEE